MKEGKDTCKIQAVLSKLKKNRLKLDIRRLCSQPLLMLTVILIFVFFNRCCIYFGRTLYTNNKEDDWCEKRDLTYKKKFIKIVRLH